MGSALDIRFRSVDIDAVATYLRSRALFDGDIAAVTVTERAFAGPACGLWGRAIGDDLGSWRDAFEDADQGDADIRTIGGRDYILFGGAYRERVAGALAETGGPVFQMDTTFCEIRVEFVDGAPDLTMSFDRSAHMSGGITRTDEVWAGQRGVAEVEPSTGYEVPDGRPVADHIRALAIFDAIAVYGTMLVTDTTSYATDRDEIALIGASVLDRRLRSEGRGILLAQ